MASLKDQLLKAGLASKDQARKAVKQKQKQGKASTKGASGNDQSSVDALKAQLAERDRELNRQKQLKANEKAIAAQIIQLIQLNRVDRGDGDVRYNFVYQDKVKSVHITETIKSQIGQGRIVIVRMPQPGGSAFELVPRAVAEKIAERDRSILVPIAELDDESDQEDDPYADFKVPDDLMW